MAQPSALATILRHPLASKRCLLQFGSEGEEINEVFELLCQYEAVAPIGQGTYGYVCSARDNDLVEKFRVEPPEDYHDPSLSAEEKEEMYNTKTLVAVKKLRQLFENNQPRMWLCATREIQLMMAFRHDNVMSATDFFIPLGGVEMMTYESIRALQSTFDSVYVVMKKMDYTLREVLDSSYIYKNGTGTPDDTNDAPLPCPTTGVALHPLSQDYRKFILYQILCGVGYLHLCPVMHRDLKPENIMLDCMYNTCITDFGQGRDVEVTGDSYAQTVLDNCTQWYAAPETLTLMASSPTGFIDHHSFHGVDVWSIGCIAAEMLLGRPLFATGQMGGPGQLRSIYQVVGHPSDSAIEAIAEHRDATSRDTFIAVMKHIIHVSGDSVQRQSRLKEVLQSPFGDVDDDERELIAGMLAWDPRERITIQTALESPYFIKAQYSPVIDPDDTAKRVPSVRPEEISEAVTGRAFLWDLFVQRHPEVGELWHSLVEKHEESMRAQAQTPAAPSA